MDWVVTKYDYYSKITVSKETKMIFPRKMIVALPNPDLQDDIRSDYLEATIRLKKMPLVRWCCLRPPMPPTTWGLLKKQIASWLDCSQGPWRRQL